MEEKDKTIEIIVSKKEETNEPKKLEPPVEQTTKPKQLKDYVVKDLEEIAEEYTQINGKVIVSRKTDLFMKISVITLFLLLLGGLVWFNINFKNFANKDTVINTPVSNNNFNQNNISIESNVSTDVTIQQTTNLNATIVFNSPTFIFYQNATS